MSKFSPTDSAKLERWLGKDQANNISAQFKDWYGPPVALAGVPGNVFIAGGGDFLGRIDAGGFMSGMEMHFDRFMRITKRMSKEAVLYHGAGFSSLSDMISKWTQSNKGQTLTFNKSTSITTVTGRGATSWYLTGTPGAGAAGAAAPGGTVHAKGDTGSYPIINTTTGSEGLFCVSGFAGNTTANGALLLYDRLFSCAKTMSSSASQAVTGVPTRYQSTTSSDWDYAGGNFMVPEITSNLSATAHNWTVMQYTNQAGVTASIAPSTAGVSSAAAGTIDLPVSGGWYMPLASGDIGVQALTQMQCSAAALTGGITWVVGHPLAVMPLFGPQTFTPQDWTNSAFGPVRMYDTACLSTLFFASSANAFQPSLVVNVLIG